MAASSRHPTPAMAIGVPPKSSATRSGCIRVQSQPAGRRVDPGLERGIAVSHELRESNVRGMNCQVPAYDKPIKTCEAAPAIVSAPLDCSHATYSRTSSGSIKDRRGRALWAGVSAQRRPDAHGDFDASSVPTPVPSGRGWRSLPLTSSGSNGSTPFSVGRSAVLHPPPSARMRPTEACRRLTAT